MSTWGKIAPKRRGYYISIRTDQFYCFTSIHIVGIKQPLEEFPNVVPIHLWFFLCDGFPTNCDFCISWIFDLINKSHTSILRPIRLYACATLTEVQLYVFSNITQSILNRSNSNISRQRCESPSHSFSSFSWPSLPWQTATPKGCIRAQRPSSPSSSDMQLPRLVVGLLCQGASASGIVNWLQAMKRSWKRALKGSTGIWKNADPVRHRLSVPVMPRWWRSASRDGLGCTYVIESLANPTGVGVPDTFHNLSKTSTGVDVFLQRGEGSSDAI